MSGPGPRAPEYPTISNRRYHVIALALPAARIAYRLTTMMMIEASVSPLDAAAEFVGRYGHT